MKESSPPRWMEAILLLTLPPRDHESIPGDLQEEYRHVKLPQSGPLHANVWYARQVLSFLPHHLAAVFAQSPALLLICGFTAMCGLWLGAMGIRLRHPGYVEGELISAIIVLQALLTISALCFRPVTLMRRAALLGTAAVLWLAVKALIAAFSGANFEGYILLIALALLIQSGLTLRTLPRWHSRTAN